MKSATSSMQSMLLILGKATAMKALRHTMTKWPHHPNLRKKPHAPSKGRGPVQRAIRRAFMASGAEVLNSRHTMTKWPHHPTLRKKPHAPSKGRGPVQRAIRRAFMASGAEVLNSTDIYDWAHGRRRFGRRKSMPFGVYSRTLRTLRAMCEPVGRAPTI